MQEKISLSSLCIINRVLDFIQMLYRKFKLTSRINLTNDDFEEYPSLSNEYWIKHKGMYYLAPPTLHIFIDILNTPCRNKFFPTGKCKTLTEQVEIQKCWLALLSYKFEISGSIWLANAITIFILNVFLSNLEYACMSHVMKTLIKRWNALWMVCDLYVLHVWLRYFLHLNTSRVLI